MRIAAKDAVAQALRDEFLARLGELRVDQGHGRRKPHKPLLLLLAIARLVRYGVRELPFDTVERELQPLLDLYAPPVKAGHEPKLPYWHLRSDSVWAVAGADRLARNAKGFPTAAALRASAGGIDERFIGLLQSDPEFARQAVAVLLERNFPASLHADVLAGVGLDAARWLGVVPLRSLGGDRVRQSGPARDPAFRERVLQSYEGRCAVTGFAVSLRGLAIGVEAAHVQWHAYGGPDVVANGLPLSPTLHTLFDHGAWTLTDDRRVLVAKEFDGSSEGLASLRPLHGVTLRRPLREADQVGVDFIRWHREAELGGVFRGPEVA